MLCLIYLFSQNASASWSFDKNSQSIYSVYKSKDDAGWTTFVLMTVKKDEVSFTATVARNEYNKIFTLNPSTILKLEGNELVKHDTFFWGENDNPEEVKIDGKTFKEFYKSTQNNYQIFNNETAFAKLIKALSNSKEIILSKHFWLKGKKLYPKYSLLGFKSAYEKYIKNNDVKIAKKDFNANGLMCKENGSRKLVWINTDHGTYALNGSAMDWVENTNKQGTPLIGSDGLAWKMGRDYIGSKKLNELIQSGVKKCD